MAIDENGEDIVIDFDVGRSFLPDAGERLRLRAVPPGDHPRRIGLDRRDAAPVGGCGADSARGGDQSTTPSTAARRSARSWRRHGPTLRAKFKASFLRPGRYTVVPEDLERSVVGPTAYRGGQGGGDDGGRGVQLLGPLANMSSERSEGAERRCISGCSSLRTVSEMRSPIHRRDLLRLARRPPRRRGPPAVPSPWPAEARRDQKRPAEQPSPPAGSRPAADRVSFPSSCAGSDRDGALYVPPSYRPDAPAPLILTPPRRRRQRPPGTSPPAGASRTRTGLLVLVPDSREAYLGRGPGRGVRPRRGRSSIARSTWYSPGTRWIPPGIVAEGFSDGASYALCLGLLNGDLFTHVIAFSPGFVTDGSRRGKPRVFVSHGVGRPGPADRPVQPAHRAGAARRRLRRPIHRVRGRSRGPPRDRTRAASGLARGRG